MVGLIFGAVMFYHPHQMANTIIIQKQEYVDDAILLQLCRYYQLQKQH